MMGMVADDLRLAYRLFTGRPEVADGNGNGSGTRLILSTQGILAVIQLLGMCITVAYFAGQSYARLDAIDRHMTAIDTHMEVLDSRVAGVERDHSIDHSVIATLADQVKELFGMYGKGGSEITPSSKDGAGR